MTNRVNIFTPHYITNSSINCIDSLAAKYPNQRAYLDGLPASYGPWEMKFQCKMYYTSGSAGEGIGLTS